MQILSGARWSQRELDSFREIIHANILESIQSLLRACQVNRIVFTRPESTPYAHQVLSIPIDGAIFPSAELSQFVVHFWTHEQAALQQAIHGRTFTMLDSAPYFLENAQRCLSPSFVPNDADIIRARVRTTGVNEFTLHFQKDTFMFIDVGGQRGERKKWIHAFSDVAALFYVASLSEYDQVMEQQQQNNHTCIPSLLAFTHSHSATSPLM